MAKKSAKELLTVIVPCFNEQESLPLFYKETTKVLKTMITDYELLFVDDGSKDSTIEELRKLAKEDKKVRYYSFSRNFGKEAAMYCGLQHANGDYVVVMDADLQHSPSLLPEMLNKIKIEGYDSAAVKRMDMDGENPLRKFFSNSYNNLMNKMSSVEMIKGQMDFRMMNRKMVNAVLSISEYNRFTKGIFSWVGFKTYWIEAKNEERVAGTSKWNFFGLFKYAIDGMINFSNAPLDFVSLLGGSLTLIGFIYLVFIIIKYLAVGDPVQGWATIMCVMIIIGGVQLISIGIIGQYIGKTYLETKNRPVYIVDETNNLKDKDND